ncbi:MAG: Ger(x)C family spore germination protein, partial [Clostridia bacterium]|nr:Ger(x)C family spore germination protein [Clostridia bacterium]
MRVKLCLLLSIVLCFSLTGCSQPTPLKDKLIVEGIGVDFEEEKFQVTVQVYSPSGDSQSKGESQMFSEKGETVGEALAQIDKNLGKTSFYADTKVIVLSYKALQRGLWSNLDVFIRSSEMGSNVCVAATNEKPSDLFSIEKEGNNMPAKVLADGLRYGKNNNSPVSGELMRVAQGLMDESVTVSMPVVKITEKDKKKYPLFEGILCFLGDQPVYVLDESMKWVYHWMNDYSDQRSFLVDEKDGKVSLLFRNSQIKVDASIQNQGPHFDISLKAVGEVAESSAPYSMSQVELEKLKVKAEEKMKKMILSTLEQVVNEKGCDAFRLGKTLRKQQSDYLKSLSSW